TRDKDIALRGNNRGCEWTVKSRTGVPVITSCQKIRNQNWGLEVLLAGVTSFHEVGRQRPAGGNAGCEGRAVHGFSRFVGWNPAARRPTRARDGGSVLAFCGPPALHRRERH